ncbi:MAG: HEAT repeat domain-containing protein [Methanoregula sp.]
MEGEINYGKRKKSGETVVQNPAVAVKKFQKPLFEYLISGLNAEDKWVRVMAAGMLGALGDPGATAHLKPLAVDRDADLREISRNSLKMLASGYAFLGTGRQDPCDSCMIRIIAEEALSFNKSEVPLPIVDTNC